MPVWEVGSYEWRPTKLWCGHIACWFALSTAYRNKGRSCATTGSMDRMDIARRQAIRFGSSSVAFSIRYRYRYPTSSRSSHETRHAIHQIAMAIPESESLVCLRRSGQIRADQGSWSRFRKLSRSCLYLHVHTLCYVLAGAAKPADLPSVFDCCVQSAAP